ncbi:MAG TPA: EAL domain-containing protein [Rhizobacter sp.]|nr:EAL domain-containing protein [Rhizobacter sp.]
MDRILVVEDESIIALNLERTLVRLGYQVVGVAGTSAAALSLSESERPDLVLMDINLGAGGDGIATAALLSRQHRTPVIYLTAYSEDATLKRARDTGPYGYLLKPFSERELHATIQMALERFRSDTALADDEERLQLALNAAEMGSWELDADSGRLRRQGLTDHIFELDAQTFDGSWTSLLDRVVPEDRAAVRKALAEAVDRSGLMSIDFRALRGDGTQPWLRLQARSYVRPGVPPRLVGVAQDISVQRQGEAALRQAATVFSSAKEAIFIADTQLRLVAVNEAFYVTTGCSAADVIGKRIDDWLLYAAAGQATLELSAELRLHGHWQGELMGRRQGGSDFPVWLNLTSVPSHAGSEAQVVGMFSDIGALRRAEHQLLHLAHHDPLTGLPNRLLAIDRLDQAISRAKRHRWRTAVMMLDLDHFKRINDTLGHSAGDELLCIVAARLKGVLRAEDTVARLGGDEFILILENIDSDTAIAGVAAKLLQGVSEPLMLFGSEVRPAASLGISLFPNDADDRDKLVRAADTAMYAAKENGRHRPAFYAPEMTEKLSRLVATEQDLRRGLAAGELRVHYQPQVTLADMSLVGLEALVRWQHPQRSLLGADEIIPAAEESGLIVEVGLHVLNTVCRQIRAWLDLGLACPRVAVNISVRQLRPGLFPELVAQALADAGITADRLELELTESTLQQESVCVPALVALDKMGVALAIDDFGTGYSSLASLRRLPVGRCKIDRIFVCEIATDVGDAAIAGAIIDMGHRLNVQITAEGVETEAQLATLRAMGCDDVQGYLLARPMPADEAERLLWPASTSAGRGPPFAIVN